MICPKEDAAPVVMVADDDITLRLIAREHLESSGFVVIEAVDGREAIEKFRSLEPDAILMDVRMPNKDGISACEEIRQLPGAERVPILILTAHDDVREIERAYAAGATEFTSKPVNWTIELHRLQYMLRAAAVTQDLREKETQLRHSQKMEALGRLASGVAHDFNNILTAISGYSVLAATQLPTDHVARPDINRIREATKRATDLTRQLLTFSRGEVPNPDSVCLNEVVAEMEDMLRRIIGEGLELSVDLDPDIGSIEANLNQVEQVIMNLVVNAADAIGSTGEIVIGTADVEFDHDEARQNGQISAGRYAVLRVRDDGSGIDPDLQQQIFEPFFTTKKADEGTGLGLSTVYGIVRSTGGTVEVDSQLGYGTCFWAYFPTALNPTTAREEAEPLDIGQLAGGETVLVVDNEDHVRAIMLRVLEASGYEVLEASGGREALDLANALESGIDLVVSSLHTGNMGGEELAARLRSTHEGVRIVLTSGHLGLEGRGGLAVDGEMVWLEKPFTPAVLLDAVRHALDRK